MLKRREDGLFLFFVLSSEPPKAEALCQILNQTLFLYRKKKCKYERAH